MIRKTIFWAHLCTALVTGIFIFIMSFTGVMLTYESQMNSWAEGLNKVTVPAGAERLPASELADRVRQEMPSAASGSLIFSSNPVEPVSVQVGRGSSLMLNPYTGEVVEDASSGLRSFFQTMEGWHRTLNASNRELGGNINKASNLVFLFLVVSGIYLWFPRMMKWPLIRARMLFVRKPPNSKARDFNWHHVFAFWTLIPLFLVVLSGVVMSYGWASNLVYMAFGEEAPQRGGPPGGAPQGGPGGPAAAGAPGAGGPGGEGMRPGGPGGEGMERPGMPGGFPGQQAQVAGDPVNLDVVLMSAVNSLDGYSTLTIPMTTQGGSVSVDAQLVSDSGPAPRQSLTLNATTGEVLEIGEAQGMQAPPGGAGGMQSSPGQAARMWFRFVHTGQEYGVIGQTLAGIASLAGCFLVYTGFALAYRRLVQPLFRK